MRATLLRYRWQLQTVAYFGVMVSLGLAGAALGPTLPSLAAQTGVTIGAVSVLFSARSLGYLCGSLLSGRLYDHLPGHPVMAAAALLLSAMLMLVPQVPLFWMLVGIAGGWGLAESGLDVGANTLLIWVHGSAVAPYMNALHFCFGLGAMLSPMIVARMMAASGAHASAYNVLAVLVLPVVLLAFLPGPRAPVASAEHAGMPRPSGLLPLIMAFFFLHVAAEASFGGWIYTYALRRGLADEAGAAYLTAAFWAALTAGRLLSILLSARLRPRTLLMGGLAGAIASVAVIAVWPADPAALWLGAAGCGLCIGPMFAATVLLAERRMPISGATTAWFFVGTSCGAMTVPYIIGQLFEWRGPQMLLLAMAVVLLLAMLVLAALLAFFPIRPVSRQQASG
ncbi:MAG: MFS transporter [Chloroflexi bacterium]|nr:MAG: MFS transporter [Chloroflexota bacterium]RLT52989.1 MAG: MFS transporter [Chloroflexota bacterium]